VGDIPTLAIIAERGGGMDLGRCCWTVPISDSLAVMAHQGSVGSYGVLGHTGRCASIAELRPTPYEPRINTQP